MAALASFNSHCVVAVGFIRFAACLRRFLLIVNQLALARYSYFWAFSPLLFFSYTINAHKLASTSMKQIRRRAP